jgi:hypothetical protein
MWNTGPSVLSFYCSFHSPSQVGKTGGRKVRKGHPVQTRCRLPKPEGKIGSNLKTAASSDPFIRCQLHANQPFFCSLRAHFFCWLIICGNQRNWKCRGLLYQSQLQSSTANRLYPGQPHRDFSLTCWLSRLLSRDSSSSLVGHHASAARFWHCIFTHP